MGRIMIKLLALAALLLGVSPVFAAESKIYKTVDKDGNVVFTDVPQGSRGSEVVIEPANTFAPQAAAPLFSDDEEDAEDSEEPYYSSVEITAPLDDEPIRENAGNVAVRVNVSPNLDAAQGHSVQLLMDGITQSGQSGGQFALTNVDRGTHSLVAQVVDRDGNVILASYPVTFHMLRATAR